MTEIDFYILGATDNRIDFAIKLCKKINGLGRRLFVCTQDEQQSIQVSERLWGSSPSSFLANSIIDFKSNAIESLATQTSIKAPIVIAHNFCTQSAPQLNNDVLLNLSFEIPAHFSRFTRSVEIIDSDEHTKEKLRENYRFYQQRGYALKTHQLG